MLTYINPVFHPPPAQKGEMQKLQETHEAYQVLSKRKIFLLLQVSGSRNQVVGFVKRNKRYFLLQVLTKVIKAKNRFLMKAKEKKERNQRDAEGILSKRNVSFQI